MRNKHAATRRSLLRDHARDGGRGAARRDHVVDDQIAPAAADRIRVHLEMIEAVLELVANRDRRARQLAALAHELQRQPKPLRERRAEDEAARLDRENAVALRARAACSASCSMTALNALGFASTGVMSLNTMPGFGKSGTSTISDLISSGLIADVEAPLPKCRVA